MIATAAPVTLCEVASPRKGRRATAEALEQAVRRRIAQRTWGRLCRLEVEVDARRVLVRGNSPTYYLKQLALAAVQEAFPATPVEFDIVVVKSEPDLAPAGGCRAGVLPWGSDAS